MCLRRRASSVAPATSTLPLSSTLTVTGELRVLNAVVVAPLLSSSNPTSRAGPQGYSAVPDTDSLEVRSERLQDTGVAALFLQHHLWTGSGTRRTSSWDAHHLQSHLVRRPPPASAPLLRAGSFLRRRRGFNVHTR